MVVTKRRCIIVDILDADGFQGGDVNPIEDERAIWIVLDVIRKFYKRLDLFGNGRIIIDGRATPDQSLFERDDVESGNDTKIVLASLQGREKVRVGLVVGLDNPPISEHDLRYD